MTTQNNLTIFTDEENVIMTMLIAQHEQTIGNTASCGPLMEAKNRVWDLIRDRLENRIGGIVRSDEEIRTRWRSMRSSYSFKTDKARHLAEMFFRRLPPNHHVRPNDVQVPGTKLPGWAVSLMRMDRPRNVTASQSFTAASRSTPAGTPSTKKLKKRNNATSVDQLRGKSDRKRPNLVTQPERKPIPSTLNKTVKSEEPTSQMTPEETEAASVHASPAEEAFSITEMGDDSRSCSAAPYYVYNNDDDFAWRRRREDELYDARIALLNAQQKEIDARTRYTELQMEAFCREYSLPYKRCPPPAPPALRSSTKTSKSQKPRKSCDVPSSSAEEEQAPPVPQSTAEVISRFLDQALAAADEEEAQLICGERASVDLASSVSPELGAKENTEGVVAPLSDDVNVKQIDAMDFTATTGTEATSA